jgi:RNA polymerase sigma-70 factor (ECF subfamily)
VEHVFDEDGAVAAAREGDREAFCALVERYQEAAFRAAYLVVRDAAAAEDVVQEGFVRAYSALGSFREGQPFRPWLLRIVTNLALNDVRARGRRRGLLARFGRLRQDAEPAPEGAVVVGEEQALLWRAINELPGDDRVILYLRYFLELPEREIAAAVGKPAGTVKSRLHRASGRLRAVIEQRYPSLRPDAARVGGDGHA